MPDLLGLFMLLSLAYGFFLWADRFSKGDIARYEAELLHAPQRQALRSDDQVAHRKPKPIRRSGTSTPREAPKRKAA